MQQLGSIARCTLVAAVVAACGGGGGDDGGDDGPGPGPNASVFAASITQVEIEIDFETGQAPFTGPILGFGDSFDLSTANLDRIFAGTKQLVLPRTTAGMQDIGALADEELTVEDLLAIAAQHRDRTSVGALHTYYVVFVSGHFANADGVQGGVLGVSLGNTGVLAMFKDVIRGSSGLPNIATFVEQTTLIHEVGHAIGLVDNGVPLTTTHKDAEHGAHCTNDRCAMYWLVEGATDAAAYAQQYVVSGNTILFADDCLADVDALTGGP